MNHTESQNTCVVEGEQHMTSVEIAELTGKQHLPRDGSHSQDGTSVGENSRIEFSIGVLHGCKTGKNVPVTR